MQRASCRFLALVCLLVACRAQERKAEDWSPDSNFLERQAKLFAWPGSPKASTLSDYVRVIQSWLEDRTRVRIVLQTSVRILRHPDSGRRIHLLATHHMSHPAYFRALERDLESVDIVLSEGNDRAAVSIEDAAPEIQWIVRYQIAVCDLLSLVHGSYWKKRIKDERWRGLDLSLREMSRHIRRPEDGAQAHEAREKRTLEVERVLALPRDSPARRRVRGAVLRRILQPMEEGYAGRLAELHAVRDDKVVAGLRDVLADPTKKRIAIVYGAAHIAAIEPRIRKLGFRLYSTRWCDAVEWIYKPESESPR